MKCWLLLLVVIACRFPASCQEVFLGTTKDKVSNFYIMSVKHGRNGLIDVVERVKPADGMLPEFRKQITDQCRKEKINVEGFEKLGYLRRRIQYDCKGKLYRNRECTYYDIYGNQVTATDPEQSESVRWQPIPLYTMREAEFIKACQ